MRVVKFPTTGGGEMGSGLWEATNWRVGKSVADLNFRVNKCNLVCVTEAWPPVWPGHKDRDLKVPEHMRPVTV